MARLITAGFEWNSSAGDAMPSSAHSAAASASAARTGTYGLRVAGSQAAGYIFTGGALARSYFLRAYFRASAAPSAMTPIMRIVAVGGSLQITTVELTTSLTLQLDGPLGTNIGSPSAALTANTWYRIEVMCQYNSGAADDLAELLVDGVSVASTSTGSIATSAPNRISFGDSTIAHGANLDFDDVALNDSTGANQNTWPGASQIVLCSPISDGQAGSWTAGAGGVSNLFEALNNKPPTGTAAETDATQVENIDTSPDNATDEYRANLTTYTDAGVGGADTINVLHPVVVHGEDVSTSTKTGSVGLQSNPSQTYATFTYGDDAGALGTFPTTWAVKVGDPVYSPSVTLGSSPVIALRKTDTGTRVASACALGVNVDYTPSSGPVTSLMLPNRNQMIVRR